MPLFLALALALGPCCPQETLHPGALRAFLSVTTTGGGIIQATTPPPSCAAGQLDFCAANSGLVAVL